MFKHFCFICLKAPKVSSVYVHMAREAYGHGHALQLSILALEGVVPRRALVPPLVQQAGHQRDPGVFRPGGIKACKFPTASFPDSQCSRAKDLHGEFALPPSELFVK